MKKLVNQRLLRFLVGGGIAALFNLILIALLIEKLGFNTPLLRNVANILAIEVSLIVSFFIYRIWVWTGGVWTVQEIVFKQIPLYHLSAGAALALRIFLVFPLLDWLGVSYALNTLIGVGLNAVINYILSDRLVFRDNDADSSSSVDLYPPEGLSPAFATPQRVPESNHPLLGSASEPFFLSVVIPAYNEEGCIQDTVERISQHLTLWEIDFEILVVNDNSRDRTEAILQALTENNLHVRYVNNHYPNGFGFAVRCGLERFRGDAVVIAMADASDPPENIVGYYHKLREGYDCVFGSRFIRGGRVVDYPSHKLVVNRLANLFIQVLLGIPYNDTTNAFKAYRREVIQGVTPLISHHFNLTVELPLKAIVRGYSYAIVPIAWHNRKTGISKLKLKEMGSRYLFIVLYILLEKLLSRGDYVKPSLQYPEKLKA
ncbi:glycosyltransferase [Oscillatoria sp. FACHB-1407]|uniref:glycosyltransferase n=1 Tax=Oscillatoria sp. FACHB-1407 TaxID=2692847 RepID=UPI001685EEC0|nr:glycosyltransferase [Oscillatoria sp. FACHB-1407]MBD2459670.1 glycosyltransferase [Oscillatoria sp. FACHB-1407]